MKVKVGFTGGDKAYQQVIKGATGSQAWDITHAFIYLLDSIVEADGFVKEHDKYAGVWLRNTNYYDTYKTLRIIEIDIPNIEGAKNMARQLLGTSYGWFDCIKTVMRFLAKIKIFPSNVIGTHCAETVTRILRAGGLSVCPDLKPDEVSPVLLYLELLKINNKV